MQKARTNEAIRETLKANKVRLWELADILNVSEMTVNRMLRHEMPADKQAQLIRQITDYAERRN